MCGSSSASQEHRNGRNARLKRSTAAGCARVMMISAEDGVAVAFEACVAAVSAFLACWRQTAHVDEPSRHGLSACAQQKARLGAGGAGRSGFG